MRAAPAIVSLVVTDRLSRRHRGPPRHGVDRLWIQFDDLTRYGDAVSIMDTCKGVGAKTVGLKIRDADLKPAAPQQ